MEGWPVIRPRFDTKGDLYEYMLGKIASAGQNGQFCTQHHIIRLIPQRSK